ncbi:MAG: hypothetical protein O2944_00965 [Proteobacteria bacterium]|nr:hypothetical protein [Pseudomonadota bacterium]
MAERPDGEKTASAGDGKSTDNATAKAVEKSADKPAEKTAAKPEPAKKSDHPTAKDNAAGSAASRAGAAAGKQAKSSGPRALFILILIVVIGAGGAYASKGLWLAKAKAQLASLPVIGKMFAGPETQASAALTGPAEVQKLAARISALEQKSTADPEMAALKAERARVQANLSQALQRIDDIERRIADLRNIAGTVAAAGAGAADLGLLLSRLNALETSGAVTRTEVQSLSAKISDAAASGAGADAKARATVLAVAQLRSAALSGAPYESALKSFAALAGDNPALKAAARGLAAGATGGLPTEASLRTGFGKIVGQIITMAGAGGDGWFEKAATRLKTLATLRRTDGSAADSTENAVAVIEAKLAAADLGAAFDQAQLLRDKLNAEARALLEGWLAQARVRIDAIRGLDAMQAHAVAELGGG